MLTVLAAFCLSSKTVGRPAWRLKVGGYELVQWQSPEGDVETLYLLDGVGRVVTAVRGYHVTVLGDQGWREKPIRPLKSFTGRGKREIVIREWSGGAHGSMGFFIWTLGAKPKCILAYDKNNSLDEKDFEFKDLDGDGTKEIVSFYDGFSYQLSGAYGGLLPFVMKLKDGRYQNATSRFTTIVGKSYEEARRDVLIGDEGEGAGRYYREAAARVYALGLLRNSPRTAEKFLRENLPKSEYRWLQSWKGHVSRVVDKMDDRLFKIDPYRKGVISMYGVSGDSLEDILPFSNTPRVRGWSRRSQ